ncbi:MAG: ImmA/IrrE family metallo-endopeptidase, partial [Solirubrobacterales bacterium]
PDRLTIANLARALRFPVDFFHGDTLDEPPIDGASFRSLSKLTARKRDQALASGALALMLAKWIDERFDLPEPDVPQYRDVDPETAAEAVRSAWRLGQRPVKNMVHLLEAHGVRVFSLAEECHEVDAFSFWLGPVPYVFLNTKKTAEHSRMDAAHELGHLVMHAHGGPSGREAETQAQAFGAAFLMPAASIVAEVPPGARLPQLVKHKQRWKVSAWNIAHRCHKLRLLTEWQYRSICVALSKRGKANEPRPMRRQETSQVLRKIFRALRAENVTKAEVARQLHVPADELNKSMWGLVLTTLEGSRQISSGAQTERPALKVV